MLLYFLRNRNFVFQLLSLALFFDQLETDPVISLKESPRAPS